MVDRAPSVGDVSHYEGDHIDDVAAQDHGDGEGERTAPYGGDRGDGLRQAVHDAEQDTTDEAGAEAGGLDHALGGEGDRQAADRDESADRDELPPEPGQAVPVEGTMGLRYIWSSLASAHGLPHRSGAGRADQPEPAEVTGDDQDRDRV